MTVGLGVDSDYWGFADSKIVAQRSGHSASKSEGQCLDSNGDVAASAMYDCFSERSMVYGIDPTHDTLVIYDTTTGVDFRLGKVIGGYVITSMVMRTANNGFREIEIGGRTCATADSVVKKYDQSTYFEVAPTRKAVAFGYTPAAGVKVVSSEIAARVEPVILLDSVGDEQCVDVGKGRIEATNELAGATANPSGTADSTWTLSDGPSIDKENTGYPGGSVSLFKNLAVSP